MEIKITARELLDRDLWMKACELTGTNDWAINEGRMSVEDTISLTENQAKKLGLIPGEPEEEEKDQPSLWKDADTYTQHMIEAVRNKQLDLALLNANLAENTLLQIERELLKRRGL